MDQKEAQVKVQEKGSYIASRTKIRGTLAAVIGVAQLALDDEDCALNVAIEQIRGLVAKTDG